MTDSPPNGSASGAPEPSEAAGAAPPTRIGGRRLGVRRFGAGVAAVVASALAIGVFVAAVALSFRIGARWSVVESRQLPPVLDEAFGRVSGHLEMAAAFERTHPLARSVKSLLLACENGARTFPAFDLSVESLDLNHDPAAAAALLRRESMPANSLLVRLDGRSRLLDEFALADAAGRGGSEFSSVAAALAAAVNSLARRPDATVSFLSGHGEYDPFDANPVTGASLFARQLESAGWRVVSFSTSDTGVVPPETDVLVVAGPRVSVPANEAERLSSWISGGGRALFMFDDSRGAGLSPLLSVWGLALGKMADADLRANRSSIPTAFWGDHPAVRGIAGLSARWTSPCAVLKVDHETLRVPPPTPLAYVAPAGGSGEAVGAMSEPQCVAAAVAADPPPGVSSQIRIAVCGDADMLCNANMSGASDVEQRFLLSLIDWLAEQKSPASDLGVGEPRVSDAVRGEDFPADATGLHQPVSPRSPVRLLLVMSVFGPLAILAFGWFVFVPIARP